jgi:hypothetical protein
LAKLVDAAVTVAGEDPDTECLPNGIVKQSHPWNGCRGYSRSCSSSIEQVAFAQEVIEYHDESSGIHGVIMGNFPIFAFVLFELGIWMKDTGLGGKLQDLVIARYRESKSTNSSPSAAMNASLVTFSSRILGVDTKDLQSVKSFLNALTAHTAEEKPQQAAMVKTLKKAIKKHGQLTVLRSIMTVIGCRGGLIAQENGLALIVSLNFADPSAALKNMAFSSMKINKKTTTAAYLRKHLNLGASASSSAIETALSERRSESVLALLVSLKFKNPPAALMNMRLLKMKITKETTDAAYLREHLKLGANASSSAIETALSERRSESDLALSKHISRCVLRSGKQQKRFKRDTECPTLVCIVHVFDGVNTFEEKLFLTAHGSFPYLKCSRLFVGYKVVVRFLSAMRFNY